MGSTDPNASSSGATPLDWFTAALGAYTTVQTSKNQVALAQANALAQNQNGLRYYPGQPGYTVTPTVAGIPSSTMLLIAAGLGVILLVMQRKRGG